MPRLPCSNGRIGTPVLEEGLLQGGPVLGLEPAGHEEDGLAAPARVGERQKVSRDFPLFNSKSRRIGESHGFSM